MGRVLGNHTPCCLLHQHRECNLQGLHCERASVLENGFLGFVPKPLLSRCVQEFMSSLCETVDKEFISHAERSLHKSGIISQEHMVIKFFCGMTGNLNLWQTSIERLLLSLQEQQTKQIHVPLHVDLSNEIH